MFVLLLEDEWLVARDMERALRNAGHRVTACTSVSEALSCAVQGRPDLMLTNVDLGVGGSGLEAAGVFLRRFGVPSLFVSGSRKAAEAAKGAALGILTK